MNDLLDTFNRVRNASGQPEINPLIATAITANTMAAAKADAQRADAAEAQAQSKFSMRIKSDGTADISGVPMQNMVKAREETARTLSERAKSALRSMGAAPADEDAAERQAESGGFRDAYRASRKMGHKRGEAILAALGVKTGLVDRQAFGDAARTNAAATNAANYQRFAKPLEDQIQQDTTESRMLAAETRRNFEQYLGNNLLDLGSEEDAVKVGRQRVTEAGGTFNDSMAEEIRSRYRGQKREAFDDLTKTVSTRIRDLKPESVEGHGSFDDWYAVQTADLGALPMGFKKRFEGEYKRLQGLAQDKRKKEAFQMRQQVFAMNREVRAAESAARQERSEARSIANQQTAEARRIESERQSEIKDGLKSIDGNNKRLLAIGREIASMKYGSPQGLAALYAERDGLIQQNRNLVDKLGTLGIVFKTKQKSAPTASAPSVAAPGKRKVLTAEEALARLK